MKKLDFRKLLQDRKTLYLVLCIAVVSIFTLSIAYAAMSTVLEIHGNSEVVASSWDIYLDNVEVKSGSVATNAPVISGNSTLAFDVELNSPGDYYEFTVDVVNEGTIDAMIDSVVKTPNLTTEQAKYIKYEITYENGESISTKQTLKKGTTTSIKVRVEYRKDLVAGDLPSSSTELSLKLTLVYIQSDGTGSVIPDNGAASVVTVVSGDGATKGNEVCIGEECFYVISSTDTTVTMLAKYNLHVGNSIVDADWNATPLSNPTGKQDRNAIGYIWDDENSTEIYPFIGTIAFSSSNYWSSTVSSYPAYVCNSSSNLYTYVENYKTYLVSLGVTPSEIRLITKDELISLGCSEEDFHCSEAPDWVYATSYWSGSAENIDAVWYVCSDTLFGASYYDDNIYFGVRPVITISRSLI